MIVIALWTVVALRRRLATVLYQLSYHSMLLACRVGGQFFALACRVYNRHAPIDEPTDRATCTAPDEILLDLYAPEIVSVFGCAA